MMHAYDRTLLSKARTSLAWMFDYGVNSYGMKLEDFYHLFVTSELSRLFECGDSSVVAGMSGVEMAFQLILEQDAEAILVEPEYSINRSPEYWLGWAIAYYQWYKNIAFDQITDKVSVCDIRLMYDKYHEMDIMQFVDALDDMRKDCHNMAMLKRLRMYAGLSQRQLAERTMIPVRTIQQYEQGQKDIQKASAEYIMRLAKELYCSPEDLLR